MNFSSQNRLGLFRQAVYTIQVEGRLISQWASIFGKIEISESRTTGGGTVTTITKTCIDQGELYAILIQLRDLGLPLLSVMCTNVESDFTPEDHPSG